MAPKPSRTGDAGDGPPPPFSPYLTTTAAAAYCGFRTSSALRKAAREGRIAPAGRRGGSGTWMWRREDLDAFVCGRTPANLSGGRSSAPPSGGANDRAEMGAEVELVDRAKAVQARRMAQEGGRIPGPGTSRRFPHREDERSPVQRGGDRRARGVHALAERAQEGSYGRDNLVHTDADLQRIRRVALRGQGEG